MTARVWGDAFRRLPSALPPMYPFKVSSSRVDGVDRATAQKGPFRWGVRARSAQTHTGLGARRRRVRLSICRLSLLRAVCEAFTGGLVRSIGCLDVRRSPAPAPWTLDGWTGVQGSIIAGAFGAWSWGRWATERGVHTLVPGLTGWAQVNGRDDLSILDKVKLDAAYLRRQSVRFDGYILWLTFVKVLRRDKVSH